jgi:hypothetical protein
MADATDLKYARARMRIEERMTSIAVAIFVGDFYARLFPPHRYEHHRFVICVRDADKPVNAFLLQPLAYRLLQYAPVGAMKYLHFHLQRFS